MQELVIGDLHIKVPIVQGGMGIGISMAGLSSAVANEGAIGVVSAVGLGLFEPDSSTHFVEATVRALRREIQKARTMTKGVLGMNAMVALTHFDDLVKTGIEEGIDIIFAGAGLPLNLPSFLTPGCKTKLAPIVSSGRAAGIICRKWKEQYDYLPDAIVIEGPKAGGHLGFKYDQIPKEEFSLEVLLADVKANVKEFETQYNVSIPLIVGGGVYTGEDIYNFIKLGAAGVQMGTRFVTTTECDASDTFKQMYIDAKEEDIQIINSPVGMPGRAINNEFLDKVKRGEKHPINCHFHCLRTCDYKTAPYCILNALLSAARGNMKHGFAFSGSNAYRAEKIISVNELINELSQEYDQAALKDK